MLEKRSEASTSARAVGEEFAALWLPFYAVDLELLVPALKRAGVQESQSSAARVRKDLLNIILADLISNDHSQDASSAKLGALSDAFDAYQKAAEQEREGWGRTKAIWAGGSRTGSTASEVGIPTWTKSLERRWICWRRVASPSHSRASVPVGRMTCPGIPATPQSETTKAVSHQTMMGGSSRGRGGSDQDESGRFTSEGRSSRSRSDEADNRSRDRDESGRFSEQRNGARPAVTMTMITDRAVENKSGRFISERIRDDDDDWSRGRYRVWPLYE